MAGSGMLLKALNCVHLYQNAVRAAGGKRGGVRVSGGPPGGVSDAASMHGLTPARGLGFHGTLLSVLCAPGIAWPVDTLSYCAHFTAM